MDNRTSSAKTLADKLHELKNQSTDDREKEIIDIILSRDIYASLVGLFLSSHPRVTGCEAKEIFKGFGDS